MLLSLNPVGVGGDGRSCIQKRAPVLGLKSCQRWSVGWDWRYRSASRSECVSRAQRSSCFLFQLLRSLGCSPERARVRARVCVCEKERERERARAACTVDFSLSSTPTLICMLLQPPLSLSPSLSPSLPLSLSALCVSLSELFFPPSFPHSLYLTRSPLSTSRLYLLSGCWSSPCSLYRYLARSADNSHHNSSSFFVCKKPSSLPHTHTHTQHSECMHAGASICLCVCLA